MSDFKQGQSTRLKKSKRKTGFMPEFVFEGVANWKIISYLSLQPLCDSRCLRKSVKISLKKV